MFYCIRFITNKIPKRIHDPSLFYSIMSISNPVECTIKQKLTAHFKPMHQEVINESFMHNVPKGSETHFKVMVVSEKFSNLPLIKRHRMVNDILKTELENGVHALSIITKSPNEWEKCEHALESSPTCRGGFGK